MDKIQKRQLESNDLADKVMAGFDKIQPYLTTIVIVVAVCLVGFIVFYSINSNYKAKLAEINAEIFNHMNDSAKLEELAQNASQQQVDWALILAGNNRLQEAVASIHPIGEKESVNRAAAIEALNQAEKNFKAILDSSKSSEALQMATYGLARVYEQRVATTPEKSDENLNLAIDMFTKLTQNWPNGLFVKQAQMRIVALSNPNITKVLVDYSTYEKTEAKAGERNDIPLDIATQAPAEEAKPAETTPAQAEEAKPAETAPAQAEEAKPAETAPAQAEEAKPAETAPAQAEEAK